MKRIGILGGGQLGCMLAESLYRLGATVAVYDPDPEAPLCRRTDRITNAAWDNVAALENFAADCDRVTYEFENVESEPLRALASRTEVWPSVDVLAITQHRGREKRFLAEHGLPHVWFQEVHGHPPEEAVIVKTVRGGYDGKGQVRWTPGSPWPALAGPCIAEEIIDIEKEVSCIVARSPAGAEAVFPVFENTHQNHILDTTVVPSTVPAAVQREVQTLALTAARRLQIVGLLTTEFFLTRHRPRRSVAVEMEEWYILVNEFAPRPHNSGHVTRQACTFSQFDALARILLEVPLGSPELVDTGVWGMGNLLGDVYGPHTDLDLSPWKDHPTVREVCLYGKIQPRAGRKMGHFVVRDATLDRVLSTIRTFRHGLHRY